MMLWWYVSVLSHLVASPLCKKFPTHFPTARQEIKHECTFVAPNYIEALNSLNPFDGNCIKKNGIIVQLPTPEVRKKQSI